MDSFIYSSQYPYEVVLLIQKFENAFKQKVKGKPWEWREKKNLAHKGDLIKQCLVDRKKPRWKRCYWTMRSLTAQTSICRPVLAPKSHSIWPAHFQRIGDTHKHLKGLSILTWLFCLAAFSRLSSSCFFVNDTFVSSPQFPLFPLVLPSGFCNFCYLPGTSGNLTFQSLSTQLSLNLEKCYSRPSKIWSLCTFQARPFVHPSFSQSGLSFNSLNILCISEFHVFVPLLSLKYSFTPYATHPSGHV